LPSSHFGTAQPVDRNALRNPSVVISESSCNKDEAKAMMQGSITTELKLAQFPPCVAHPSNDQIKGQVNHPSSPYYRRGGALDTLYLFIR
jgi:hypothetical protein